ncbi:MAG: fertility inhibition FinO-like protein [Hydrococcus sp. RM1_1_31]|nr:fertility inhibition FinO-like protein [Hydrococcus sp. RM1_1_31]
MPVLGKIEITIKINEFPVDVQTVQNSWKQFEIDCEGRIVNVTVKPKVFKKLEEARDTYPLWVAAIRGTMGELTDKGFVLEQPSIQVFERLSKQEKAQETKASA